MRIVSDKIIQLGNVIGYILQSIYFSKFMLDTKGIKEKRILFNVMVFGEFILLKYICKLNYTINFEITFGLLLYLIIKLIYKRKARITDITIYILAMLFLGVVSVLTSITIGMNMMGLIVSCLVSILLIHLFRLKLARIDEFYTNFWNRHNNKRMLKSITIRGFSSFITVITILLAHLWLIYGVLVVRR